METSGSILLEETHFYCSSTNGMKPSIPPIFRSLAD